MVEDKNSGNKKEKSELKTVVDEEKIMKSEETKKYEGK